jgi:hypothetical protein
VRPQRCGLDPAVGFSPRRGSGTKFCERIGSGHDVVVCGVELVTIAWAPVQAERRAAGTVNRVAGTTSVLGAGGGHADAVVPWAAACEISEARSSISVTPLVHFGR